MNKLKNSYNYRLKKCRINKVHSKTGIKDTVFMDLNTSEIITNSYFKESNYQFELNPYKPYFLFRLLWTIKSLIAKIKVVTIKKFRAWSLLEKISITLTILVGLIALYEFIIKPSI